MSLLKFEPVSDKFGSDIKVITPSSGECLGTLQHSGYMYFFFMTNDTDIEGIFWTTELLKELADYMHSINASNSMEMELLDAKVG